ncbi:MAG: hypothetical protein BGP24_09700 [Lysobacterales bacterium 69-70]|nr:hypothetical protein [Xanthomonadaceae bacterium]ODU33229.1 MAG: hypothetical protein ABS97_12725 [Xanthomonadaceae bacterium SCN 69-320]ODV20445.1 MAG: hypothetical protein ABT27_06945 [Xanthomonadaceae bacterium SCN 69-25]OJZ00773.1 MAG: hypothetical protein BGP24_09700 [Xanthomonadales bacterium 69-70]
MTLRFLATSLLAATTLPALAHDPAAHSRRPPAKPAECAALDGKDPATIDPKNPTIKAAYDKCEAAKKDARKAADAAAEAEHDH